MGFKNKRGDRTIGVRFPSLKFQNFREFGGFFFETWLSGGSEEEEKLRLGWGGTVGWGIVL